MFMAVWRRYRIAINKKTINNMYECGNGSSEMQNEVTKLVFI